MLPSASLPATDRELVEAIGSGDQLVRAPAEDMLVRRYAPRVAAYGRRHLASEDEARELTQRVMWVVVQKLRKAELREPERLGGFVLGTARNTAMALRRGARRDEPLPELEPTAAATPDPLAVREVALALEGLAERERSIVVLSFVEERTASEIGALLGLQEGHVRVLRHRALARLRNALGGTEQESP